MGFRAANSVRSTSERPPVEGLGSRIEGFWSTAFELPTGSDEQRACACPQLRVTMTSRVLHRVFPLPLPALTLSFPPCVYHPCGAVPLQHHPLQAAWLPQSPVFSVTAAHPLRHQYPTFCAAKTETQANKAGAAGKTAIRAHTMKRTKGLLRNHAKKMIRSGPLSRSNTAAEIKILQTRAQRPKQRTPDTCANRQPPQRVAAVLVVVLCREVPR